MPWHIKKHGNSLAEIYTSLGCSRQNISYWNIHSYSTQSKKSIYKVLYNAETLFELSPDQSEALANSSGLSFHFEKIDLIQYLGYDGTIKALGEHALISERMLRYYKKMIPTKQALTAIAVSLGMTSDDIDNLLHKYGYCLSESIAGDAVIRWHTNPHRLHDQNESRRLLEINSVLERMGIPLLMTRQR